MAWVRLDDALPDNPKIERLSDRAFRLYLYGLCLCGRKLTDGAVTVKDQKVLLAQVGASQRHVRELEDAGLWVRVNGHMVVNDYLAYNPTKAKVLEDREAARLRMKERRRERSGEHPGEPSGHVRLPPTPTPTPSENQDLSNEDSQQALRLLRQMQSRIGRDIT